MKRIKITGEQGKGKKERGDKKNIYIKMIGKSDKRAENKKKGEIETRKVE